MRKIMEAIERINEDKPCSICKGQGRPWDPYATYEGGAYRDCEACRGTGDESVRLGELEDDLDEDGLEDVAQRQDSTKDQLSDLIPLAEKYGMYDAADYLKLILKNNFKTLSENDSSQDNGVDLKLPRGKKVVLQVEDSDYKRGLIVEAKDGGGYDVEYWRENPSNVVTAEVKVDGKSIKDDAKLVYLGFHPEKGDTE